MVPGAASSALPVNAGSPSYSTLHASPNALHIMPEQANVDEQLLARFEEVLQPEGCDDWGAKLQDLCESFWEFLEQDNDILPQYVDAFVNVLLREESFALVRLVIPEFRSEPAAKLENHHKQQIMVRTTHIRAKLAIIERTNQAQFDEPLYRAEKDIIAEAEMYRASLLLYNSANLDTEQKDEVRKWLAARPGAPPQATPE